MASSPPPPPPVEEEGEEIVVTGKRLPKQRDFDDGTGGDPGTGTPGEGGDGGEIGGDGGYYEVPVEPLETPCVSTPPDGASLHDINRQALRVTNTIEGLDVENVRLAARLTLPRYSLRDVPIT